MTTKELLGKNYGSEVDLVIVECNKYYCGRRFEFKKQNWNWKSIPEDILNREVTHISLYDYKFIINVDLENNNTLARKVLFTCGMSADGLIIITDMPVTVIEDFCRKWNICTEEGRSCYDLIEGLKAKYYIRILYDSEIHVAEEKNIIGWDEAYDLADYQEEEEE